MSLEQCNIAVQAVLPKDKIPAGTSLTIFARALGGALATPISQNIFERNLKSGLTRVLPHLNVDMVSGTGATDLISKVQKLAGGDPGIVEKVLEVYNHAVTRTFLVALVLGCLTILPAVGMEWRSVKANKKKDEESNSKEKKSEAEKA